MSEAPAGWYPQADGRQRYWDGVAWTEHFHTPEQQRPGRVTSALNQAAGRLLDKNQGHEPDVLWSAVGKPVTGIGAGRYGLTDKYLLFETGTLRTDSQQVPIASVLDVDVKQTMTQKARGVFTVLVHIQRAGRVEVVSMVDIPNGREAQRVINETAHGARLSIQQNANTQTVRYQGQTYGAPAPQPASEPEYMTQLRKLGELRDAGILTEEEFAAKKSEILSRI